MLIKASVYQRKDGALMLYLNSDKGSVGIASNGVPDKYNGNIHTSHQKKILENIEIVFRLIKGFAVEINPNEHYGIKTEIKGVGWIFHTENEEVAYHPVASKGYYLWNKELQKLSYLPQWVKISKK